MNRLDPISLRLFVRIAETGTLTAAADSEHISAAAVSKRLTELESLLQVRLLSRSNKGVVPTPAGLALVGLARSALHELDQVRAQMQSFSRGVRGVVRVCASLSAITQFLAQPLRQFSQRYPDIELQLDEKTSPEVVQAVADNAADIGIYLPVTHGPSLHALPYREDQLAVVVPKGHALARRKRVCMQDLVEHHLIGIQSGSAIQIELGRAAASRGLPLRQRFQVSSFDPLCAMVSQGLGIGVLPYRCALDHAKSKPLHVLTLSDPAAKRQFMIGVRHWESLPPAARLLHQQLLSDVTLTPG